MDLAHNIAKCGAIITIKDNPHKNEQNPENATSRVIGKLSAQVMDVMQRDTTNGSPANLSQIHIDTPVANLADAFANNASTGPR